MNINHKKVKKMKKEVKHIINVVFVAVALAMGVAVIVLSIVNETVATNDLITMLAIAVVSLSIFTLNKEEDAKKKAE